MRSIARISCIFAFFAVFVIDLAVADLPKVALQISGHDLSAEVANTQRSRLRGLMFRETLDDDSGMLFVFPENAYYGMWMKNTFIPLSVAFIDEKGFIINIADMQPNALFAYYSVDPARYALEMNMGWFTRKGITAGKQIIGLERVPEAE